MVQGTWNCSPASKLSIWGRCEKSRKGRMRKETQVRGAPLTSRENARRLWNCLHAYGRFKGEWVNKHIYSLQCYLITFSVQSTFLYSGPRCLDSAGVV